MLVVQVREGSKLHGIRNLGANPDGPISFRRTLIRSFKYPWYYFGGRLHKRLFSLTSELIIRGACGLDSMTSVEIKVFPLKNTLHEQLTRLGSIKLVL